jgi:hypothetical protein
LDNAKLITTLIARAIVHLHFQEPQEAVNVLFDALTELNFYTPEFDKLVEAKKLTQGDKTNGNAAAA